MTSRRSFLAAILAAASAPAFVRSDSLMRLWVPPARLLARPAPFGLSVGYRIVHWDKGGDDKTVILEWEPHQISLVTIPDGLKKVWSQGDLVWQAKS